MRLDPRETAFVAWCRAHGVPVTRQRTAIYLALARTRAHPTAEELHEAVRARLPAISLATVYKNLGALRDAGAVADVNVNAEVRGRWEAVLDEAGGEPPHHHLLCSRCHAIVDVPARVLPAPRVPPAAAKGYRVDRVRLQLEGLCPSCRNRA